jgi:hypothetical protein
MIFYPKGAECEINSNLIAQNTGQSAVRIIQQHLLTNKFNVIETLFPSAGPGFDAEGLDQLEQAEGQGCLILKIKRF